MANTPNMNLPLPSVGTTLGPEWAQDINDCFGQGGIANSVDTHDHSIGKGVQVTPDGINISKALTFNNHSATYLRASTYVPDPTIVAADYGSTYVSGFDLWYVDVNGNPVRITQNGTLAQTATSIPGLSSPASLTYVSGSIKFVFQSNVNTPANLDAGLIILRNNSVSSYGLSLTPPTLSGDISITLPALSATGTNKMVRMDDSGVMSATLAPDNSSLEISTNTLQVKAAGITRPMQVPVGQQVATSSSGTFSTSSGTAVLVTNQTINITTTGRPVMISLNGYLPDGAGTVYASKGADTASGLLYIYRDGVAINVMPIFSQVGGATTNTIYSAPGAFSYMDQPAAGTYEYKLYASTSNTSTVGVIYCKLVAYEL